MRGAAVMREFQPDWIVAMGGGSPIDAAKTMWVFYEYPDTTFEALITPFSFPPAYKGKVLCHPLHLWHCNGSDGVCRYHRLPEGH